MTRSIGKPSKAHHILIFNEDWEYLNAMYGAQGRKPTGVSPAIRLMIHSFVKRLRANEVTTLEALASEQEVQPTN